MREGGTVHREGGTVHNCRTIPPHVNYASFLKILHRYKQMNLNSHIPTVQFTPRADTQLHPSSDRERIHSPMNAM